MSSPDSNPDENDDDDVLLQTLLDQWRSAYLSRGNDIPPEVLCGEHVDLVSLLRGLIGFEKLNLGGPVPQFLVAQSCYEIIGKYDQGGQGDLYLANDHSFPRVVLIKRIRKDYATDPDFIRRFRREMILNGQLEHPNIVPVFDYGIDQGEPYFVMRLVPGETFHTCIKQFHANSKSDRYSSLEFQTLLQQFSLTCKAVSYAHSRFALHLDISTANIRVGEHGEVYLLDWGCGRRDRKHAENSEDISVLNFSPPVKTVSLEQERVTSRSVNPSFMSPEQALGDELTRATDIYQLGAVFYVLLTGEYPFGTAQVGTPDFERLKSRVTRGEIRHISSPVKIPKPLLSICRRAMHIDQASRYPSPDEITSEINRWLNDEFVVQHKYSLIERMEISRRKYTARWMTASGILLTSLIFAGIVGTLTYKNSARERIMLENAFSVAINLGGSDLNNTQRLAVLDSLLQNAITSEVSTKNWQLAKASTQSARCQVLGRLNRFREAEIAGVEACALYRDLRVNVKDPHVVSGLIDALQELGQVYIKRGSIIDANKCYQETLQLIGAIPGSENNPELIMQKSNSLRLIGEAFHEMGNSWLCYTKMQEAVATARIGLNLSKTDDVHRTNLGLSLAKLAYIEFDLGNHNYAGMKEACVNDALEANYYLDQCLPQSKLTSDWKEASYAADSVLLLFQRTIDSKIGDKNLAFKIPLNLEKLVSLDRSGLNWQSELLQARGVILLTEPEEEAIKRQELRAKEAISILKLQEEYRQLFPENLVLQSNPVNWMVSTVQLNSNLELKNNQLVIKDEKLQQEIEERLEADEQFLKSAIKKNPELKVYIDLLAANLVQQSTIAMIKGDSKKSMAINSASEKYFCDYYDAKSTLKDSDISWKTFLAQNLTAQGNLKNDPNEALLLHNQAIELLEIVTQAEPNNYFWLYQLLEAIQYSENDRLNIASSSGDASFHFLDVKHRNSKIRCLELLKRCCELSAGTARDVYREKIDELYQDVLTRIRSAELLQFNNKPSGAWLEKFGSYQRTLRMWQDDRLRYMSDAEFSQSPFLPQFRSNSMINFLNNLYPEEGNSRLLFLETQSEVCRNWMVNNDYALLNDSIKRGRWLRKDESANAQLIRNEFPWLARTAKACLTRIGKLDRPTDWHANMIRHVNEELEKIKPPTLDWLGKNGQMLWQEMQYTQMARDAIKNGQLDQWFSFMESEFNSAQTLEIAPQKNNGPGENRVSTQVTWAENVIYCRLVDELAIDRDLSAAILKIAETRLADNSQKPLPSTMSSALSMLASLTGDTEIAAKFTLQPINPNLILYTKYRLVKSCLNLRQFNELKTLVLEWKKAHPKFDETLSWCEVQLGNHDLALEILDENLLKTPTEKSLIGLRLRCLLDKYRGNSDLVTQLGELPAVAKEDDVNTAFVVAYVNTIQSKNIDAIHKLEEIANRPDFIQQAWAFEFIGDAYQVIKMPKEARLAYQKSSENFPPTVIPGRDLAFDRVTTKLNSIPLYPPSR